MPSTSAEGRGARRVLVSGAVCAVAIALVGVLGEQVRFGSDLAAARARIARDVGDQIALVVGRLDEAVEFISGQPTLVAAVDRRDERGTRELFDLLARASPRLALSGGALSAAVPAVPTGALTVYGPDARPIAWTGRPAALPDERVLGPDAVFLAQSPLGLRVTRVLPVFDPAAPERRSATVVAESQLPRAAERQDADDAFIVDTSVVGVAVRPGFEGPTAADAALIRTPAGTPLAVVELPSSVIEGARTGWRTAVLAAEVGLVAAVLLLLCGPLLGWRRRLSTPAGHLAATAGVVALLLAGRVIAWYALRLAGLATPPLGVPRPEGVSWLFLASPLDFLLSALTLAGGVALVASSFDAWRRRQGRHVWPVSSVWSRRTLALLITQVVAGVVVGLLVARYQDVLRSRLALMPYDLVHFSHQSIEAGRTLVGMGLVVLHAAIVGAAVLVFRAALSPWVIPSGHWGLRAGVPALWLLPGLGIVFWWMASWQDPPLVPAALVVVVAMVLAWQFRRHRAALEHASQATRLTAFFVALTLPSLVFYPSIVNAADRARRQIVADGYAPEVINQRRDLQRQLGDALEQIDAAEDLADLVRAGGSTPPAPPPTDAAFLVWSRTVLANQRSTAVELYDQAGTLVSRFALELPQTPGLPPNQEAACDWELFEEVSPFFAEDRILLHAGKGICVAGPNNRRQPIGSIVVHVTLDYGNLSFISGQSPYVAALRRTGAVEAPPQSALGNAVEFTVYGWSRRPLYMSGRDAWTLTEDVFQRAFASRDPFWATVTRGDSDYDVLFLNDRGAIYALGFPRIGTTGHLIGMAELIALSMATYLLLQIAWAVYGLVVARTPRAGRALLREVRASFYRKLFLAFVAAAVVPVLVLAFVTRAYITTLMQTDLEMEASRTAASASRVVEDVGTLEATGAAQAAIDDDLVVWLSRVIAQEVNIFDGAGLLASSERNLFASGLLPTRTQGEIYRAIVLDGRPAFVARERVGAYSYLVAAAPVRVRNRDAILTVPLTLRQQEIDAQVEELDRRVLLAVVLFIMLGAGIGYWMAERIADPVNRLTRATRRIARGELDARIVATSTDEFRRLVEAFNSMAADLQAQRAALERSNRLAAWADMARQVAHDIKNPLTPIQLNAEHLLRVHVDRGGPLGRVLEDCVQNILTQVRLLRQIASEFSTFASSPTVRPAATRLAELIDEVVDPYRPGLAGRIAIEVTTAADLPPVWVDPTVLARALTNVIENALHAMPGNGTLTVRAEPHDAASVRLLVIDTGVGMDRAALDRIFEPYFSTKAIGTGLGLTIAKRNVELNGGAITVESARGRGTTVRIMLPVVREDPMHA